MNNKPSTHAHHGSMAGGAWKRTLAFTSVAFAIATLIGCGGSSNSEVHPGSGGTSGSGSGSGGSTSGGTGGSTPAGGTGGGTVMGTGGVMVGGNDGGMAGACPAQTAFTLAVHVVVDATWPATLATQGGAGKIHLWNRAKFTAAGTMLTGDTWSCGSQLPDFSLNALGAFIAKGSKVSIDVPDSVWDAPTIPKFATTGVISGWDPGSTLMTDHTVALVGLTMADPMAAWPKSYTGIMAVDADGDGKPGFTAIPKNGNGYTLPPTDVFATASADQIYLASRTTVGLQGKLDSCMAQSGTATVSFFDSHVVGCHVKGGGECTPAQVDFIDQSRTDYMVSTGTFTAKQIKDDATCAEIRAALPM